MDLKELKLKIRMNSANGQINISIPKKEISGKIYNDILSRKLNFIKMDKWCVE
jgi:hypothetical protein